jgi:phage shock protein C
MEPKRLYRSVADRRIGGVAGGLAEYFIMDPLLIRLIFVVLALAGGGGVLIYIVLWIVTPENPVHVIPVNTDNIQQNQKPADPPSGESGPDTNTETQSSAPVPPSTPQTGKRNSGSLIGGLVLITLGALFLADELIPQINFGDLWPVLLVVIGAGLLINAFTKRNSNINQ